MKRRACIVWGITLSIVGGRELSGQLAVPVIDTVGSAQRVMSPNYTKWADTASGWTTTLERTIVLTVANAKTGGRDPEAPLASTAQFPGQLWRTLLLPDGRLIVSRGTPISLALYDTAGQFVRAIGRVGGGDSSYLAATGLAMYHDTLLVHDGLQGRVLFYTLDGKFIRSFETQINGRAPSLTIDPRGLLRVERSTQPRPVVMERLADTSLAALRTAMDTAFRNHASWGWVYFTMSGLRVDSINAPPPLLPKQWIARTPQPPAMPGGPPSRSMMMFTIPYQPNVSATFMKDGSLLSGYTDRYQFVNSRNGLDTIRIFGRSNYYPFPISRALVDSMIQNQVNAGLPAALYLVMKPEEFPRFFPIWEDITTDEQGFVWASVGIWARRTHSFQIFTPDGRYLGPVQSRWEKFDGVSFTSDHVAVPGYDTARRPVIRVFLINHRGM